MNNQPSCVDTGCSHGQCIGERCICDPGWSGDYCNIPSPDFMCKEDKDCGTWDTFGTCHKNTGRCTCPLGWPYTPHCQTSCLSNEHCGMHGTCNKLLGKCDCKDEWSGLQCKTPPVDGKCTQDKDCGWDTSHGSCDHTTGQCFCNEGYYGSLCQNPKLVPGQACNNDQECSKDDTCVNNVCIGPEGPGATVEGIKVIVEGIIDMLTTPEGLESLAIFVGAREGIPWMIRKFTEAGIKPFIKGATEEAVEVVASSIGQEAVVAGLTEGLIAEATARQIVARGVENVATETATLEARTIAKKILSPLGYILTVFDIIQILGIILDVADVAGFNEQLTMNILEIFRTKMYTMINQNDQMLKNHISLPMEYLAEHTPEFRLIMTSKENKDKMQKYMLEYLANLKVNSNGQTIVKNYYSQEQRIKDQRHNKNAWTKFMWSLSPNDRTFDFLDKYGIILMIFLVIILGYLIFNIYALKSKE